MLMWVPNSDLPSLLIGQIQVAFSFQLAAFNQEPGHIKSSGRRRGFVLTLLPILTYVLSIKSFG